MIYLVLFGSLLLRIIGLSQSLWLDEAISVLTAIKPFPFQIAGITGDFQPPLYYLALHVFLKSGITAEWFIRLPSLFAGLATVYLIYFITMRMFNRKTALISAAILATSQFHIYYSQEARMYSFLALFATLSMWFCYKKMWKSLTFIGVLGLYTNYMFVFIFIPQFIWLVLEKNKRYKNLQSWLLSLTVIILSFIPWLPIFSKQLFTARKLTSELPVWSGLSTLPLWKLLPQIFIKFTLGRVSFENKTIYAVIFVLVAGIYGYIFSRFPRKITKEIKFLLIWLFGSLVSICLFSVYIPLANVWRLIYLLIPFIILTSVTISNFYKYKILIIFVLLINMSGVLLYYSNPEFQREDWKGAVRMIQTTDYPVIFTAENGYAPFLWYGRNQSNIICGPESIDKCLTGKKVFYVSYLKDLFMSESKIAEKLKEKDYMEQTIYNYPGVGLIYLYENRN